MLLNDNDDNDDDDDNSNPKNSILVVDDTLGRLSREHVCLWGGTSKQTCRMVWWDFFVNAKPLKDRDTALESGVNRGNTAVYLESTKRQHVNTTEVDKVDTGPPERTTSNVFKRTLRKLSSDTGKKSRKLRSIAWTAVCGVVLLFVGFMLFVVGMSLGRRFSGKVDDVINTEFTYQNMQSILYAISVCFSAVFAVLAIASVQTLYVQEKKLEVYQYGARNTLQAGKGTLWSSKQMKVFIMVMNVMYIVSACYFVLQIIATWSLVLWYRDLNSITQPALSPEEEIQQILATSAGTNLTEEMTEQYLNNITERFQTFFLDQTPLNDMTAAEILCPGLFCVNLDALSFVTSDECICNATTIDSVNEWSAQARTYYIIALVGACLLFLSILVLGMRSMLAGSKAKLRVSHWEFVAPMLLSHDNIGAHEPRPSRHASWEMLVDQRRDQRVNSNQPKAPVYVDTPAGIMIDSEAMGESIPVDVDTYFPTVDLHDIEKGTTTSEFSTDSPESSKTGQRDKPSRMSSRVRMVQFDNKGASQTALKSTTQDSTVDEVLSNTFNHSEEIKELGDAESVTKPRRSLRLHMLPTQEDTHNPTRPKVLFSMEPEPRGKKSSIVSAYATNESHVIDTYRTAISSIVIDRQSSGAESSSKRSTSQHTSESGPASDHGDTNPFLYRN